MAAHAIERNPLGLNCLFNRMGMEAKIPDRIRIDGQILSTISTAKNMPGWTILDLPIPVLAALVEVADAPTQVCLSLTCKLFGRLAVTKTLNAAYVEDTNDEDDPEDDYAARYNHDLFRDYEANPIRNDENGLDAGSAFRTDHHWREGLFVDIPTLLPLLKDVGSGKTRLCGHCMTYRPKDSKYWDDKRLAGAKTESGWPLWNARTAWGKKELLINHPGVDFMIVDGKPKYITRRCDACPSCKTKYCQARTGTCIGCRMQAELRKAKQGSY